MDDHEANHLTGRVILVTGAGGGFGRLISEMTAARGAMVVAADVDGDAAAETVKDIEAAGGQARAVTADVTRKADLDAAVRTAVEAFGSVDVLVNNAGIMPLAFFADHEQAGAAWDRAIDINIKGVVNGIAAVYDRMIEQGRGHIVNISSIYGNGGSVGSGVYSATKAAVAVLSDALRVEAQGKIKVTVVRPTGVPGTNLASGIVNFDAFVGITGQNTDRYGSARRAVARRLAAARRAGHRRRRLLDALARGPRRPDRRGDRHAVGPRHQRRHRAGHGRGLRPVGDAGGSRS